MSAKEQREGGDIRTTMDRAPSGTSYLILIQVASRLLTFVGNQVLLRFLTPKILGIAFNLDLYSVFVLYVSRESLRVALQRQPVETANEKDQDSSKAKTARRSQSQTVVNASYIAIGLGLVFAFGIFYGQGGSETVRHSPYFKSSLQLYGLATILELLAEPSFVIIQQRALYKARAAAETAAAISKCLTACITAFAGNHLRLELGVLPFAVGQLAYGTAILTGYYLAVYQTKKNDGFSLLLKPVASR